MPAIAPSDMVMYQGDAFSAWKGSLLIGSMARVHLNRLVLRDGIVVLEERLANGLLGRIRSIAVDAAGLIYLGSDNGEIWRLRPKKGARTADMNSVSIDHYLSDSPEQLSPRVSLIERRQGDYQRVR